MIVAGFGSSMQNLVLTWLPVLFFFVTVAVLGLLWKTVRAMPRVKPMEITPGSSSSFTWDDVAGLDEAKAELSEIVADFLRDPPKFEALGARVPKGILFHGPPGTGKTLAAKAVANASGARFYAQSASAFLVEMFAGLGAARIPESCSRKPVRTRRRSSSSTSSMLSARRAAARVRPRRELDQTLNQLLVELDGFGPRDQVSR